MKRLAIVATSVAGIGVMTASGIGMASAATTKTGNIGSSGIPRSVYNTERGDAAAQVLNTSTTTVRAAHKDKTFAKLLSNAGLTKKTYAEKVKAQLTTDLESKGYSQDQVTIALQQRTIARLHHEDKKEKHAKPATT